ncbi:MAG TPA: hypothetical protein VGM25_11285 [Caulobacteraceae bacterium]|jgi:hypothetical protein
MDSAGIRARFCAALLVGAALLLHPGLASAKAKSAAPPVDFSGVWLKSSPGFRYADNPPYQDAARKRFDAERPQDDPGARCTYSSMPRIMISPYPLEIVQKRDHLLVLSEFNGVTRRIWLNRHEHQDIMGPTYQGDSYGEWDGKTLVVHTTGFNGKNYLNPSGDLMSDAMSVVERWSIVRDKGGKPQLKIDFTFDDPKVYTRPWSGTQSYAWRPDIELQESVCNDNNRNNPDNPGPMNFTSTKEAAPNYPINSAGR